MQTDDVMRACSGDEDSLFGSPPPSPSRGRSPALALPSGSGTSSTQNVGTIALPGSQPYSELSVNPLALSLSASHDHSRPPAQEQSMRTPVPIHVPTQAAPSMTSRASSAASMRQKRGGKGKSANSSRSATPRPAPPMILPDPDQPPPPNFLRNQQALLGVAGMVGGVNPAHLSIRRRPRGTTSTNPIVIDDEYDPPPLGNKSHTAPVDLDQLPTPSNEAIVASLIKQKNIFPVLESIIKLIAAGQTGPSRDYAPSGFEPRNTNEGENAEEQPAKRRKLCNVPAGATDWDVPYPFPSGQGPKSYGTNWEKERGKQLIGQLVMLIKAAATKAATKEYVKQHKPTPKDGPTHEPKVRGHYRPATLTYGLDGAYAQAVLADYSNLQTNTSPHDDRFAGTQQASFDQLIASMLTSQGGACSEVKHDEVGSLTSPDVSSSESSTQEFDQALFDNWMEILESFPSPENPEGLDQIPSTNCITTTPTSQILSSAEEITGTGSALNSSRQTSSPDTDITSSMRGIFPDFAIDPALLAISTPSLQPIPPAPSLAASSIASPTSLADPATPNWGDNAFTEPEIYNADQGMYNRDVNNRRVRIQFGGIDMTTEDPLTAATMLLRLASGPSSPEEQGQLPKPASSTMAAPADVRVNAMRQALPTDTTISTASSVVPEVPQPGPFKRSVAGPGRPNSKSLVKEDILRRARERRRQLAAEIERAKVELWETTIEQGVLVQMAKDV
jgi:hypothetical protein